MAKHIRRLNEEGRYPVFWNGLQLSTSVFTRWLLKFSSQSFYEICSLSPSIDRWEPRFLENGRTRLFLKLQNAYAPVYVSLSRVNKKEREEARERKDQGSIFLKNVQLLKNSSLVRVSTNNPPAMDP